MPKTQKKYGVRRRSNTRKKYRKSIKKRNNVRKKNTRKSTRKQRRKRGGVKSIYEGSLTERAQGDKKSAAKRQVKINDAERAKRNKKNKDLILKMFLDRVGSYEPGLVSEIIKQAQFSVGEPMQKAGIDNTNFAIGDGGKDKMNRQMRQQMREGIL